MTAGGEYDVDPEQAFAFAANRRRHEAWNTSLPDLGQTAAAAAGLSDYDTDLDVMSTYSAADGQQRRHSRKCTYRARQLYKNISMLFLFPVIDGKLSTGVNATFNASCYG